MERMPEPQHSIAAQMAAKAAQLIDLDHLSFGGGTVLAGRWQHRQSFDVDLFCSPDAYAGLGPQGRRQLEALIKTITGCETEATWCEDIATYTEINGIEATILPRARAFPGERRSHLAGSGLVLQSNAEILYAKIVRRMYDAGEITARDAYDIAAAVCEEPQALHRAVRHINPRIITLVHETTLALPSGWTRNDEKKVINPKYRWNEEELQHRAAQALQGSIRDRERT